MPTALELKKQYGLVADDVPTEEAVKDIPESAQERVTGGNLLMEAIGNVPSSAIKFGKDMLAPIFSPIQTAKDITAVGSSVVSLLKPGEQGNEELARQVGQFYADRYGGLENIKRTFAEDPVGFFADAGLILTGAGGAARVAGKAGTVAEKVSTAGRLIDPTTLASKAITTPLEAGGKVARQIVGTATGVGTQPYRRAFEAGLQRPIIEAGQSAEEIAKATKEAQELNRNFTQAMRGGVDEIRIVSEAKEGLNVLKENRREAFQLGEAEQFPVLKEIKVDADTKKKITSLVNDYIQKSKGGNRISAIRPKGETAKVLQDIQNVLKQANQADDVTDLSKLAQQLNEVGEGIDFSKGTQSAAFSTIKRQLEDVISGIEGVPVGYKDYIKVYGQQTDEINTILRELGVGEKRSTQAAFNKISRAIRNPRSALGKTLQLLPEETVQRLDTLVSGYLLSEALPPGLTRSLTAGLVGGGVIGGGIAPLSALPALGLVSPRLTGEATRAIGQARRGISAVTPNRFTAGLLRQVGAQQEEMERQGLL